MSSDYILNGLGLPVLSDGWYEGDMAGCNLTINIVGYEGLRIEILLHVKIDANSLR